MPYDLNCWNQSTRSWGVEKGRIASTASLNQWFTETEEYTIQPAIEYANNFGKHAVSGLFCMNLQILNFQVYQRVEKIFLLPISWICHGDKKLTIIW